MKNILLVSLLVFLTYFPLVQAAQAEDVFVKELWAGDFNQEKPLKWKGKIELYLRYKIGQDYPIKFEGILTWRDLGMARSKIEGSKTQDKISFTEGECFSGDCSKIFTGGNYSGTIDSTYSEIVGTSTLKDSKIQLPFAGSFKLKRIIADEKD